MSLYTLKPRFQALLRPMVQGMANAGITANQVTLAAALGSLLLGWWLAAQGGPSALFLLLPVWLFLRMALNAVDGMLAREHGQKSNLGGYLNELADVVSDAALYAPFALVAPFTPGWVGAVVVLSIVSEFAGVLGPNRRYDGPLGKSDRAFVFGALGLWVGIVGALPGFAFWLMPLLVLLLIATTINRVAAGLADLTPIRPLAEGSPMRPVEDHSFTTHDGVDLTYRYWPATSPTPRGAILLFHRGHEHGGRMAHLPAELDLPDFAFFAWDARGHGRSPGQRGYSPSLAHSVRDVQSFVDHVASAHGFAEEDMAVIAQSVGAVLVATWAHDYAPRIRAMILASPAFKVKLYVPFARPGLKLMHRLRGLFFVNSYVKPQYLTHDPERIASYRADPLISRPIAVNILLDLYAAADRVVADARAITVPTQMLISGADWVVHHAPQHRFFERLGTPVKERHILPGFFHDTLGERDRAIALAHARRFLLERFAEPLNRPSLLAADQMGFTRDEADALASPLPALSPRGLYWSVTRGSLRLGGALSEGIALGHATGFDSGSTLDYVYRNDARGLGPVGRFMDRNYLDSPGWTGIRQRKLHVEELVRAAMQRLADQGMPIRVMDIAAGHGRYVLEALQGAAQRPESILLRDYSDINVAAGTRMIAEKNLSDIARFVHADAFDGDSIAAVTPAPTLGIVSGLYELFPDNAMIRRSLAGMAAAIPRGGALVYTGQPWHPQLELIARALTSHRQGQAWVMRRRVQAEMDELVAEAGFRKIEQRIDAEGIFTVSRAERL
ncbi:alpha/beta fold hydrolase [Humitalea sp. 24SJ18S-53]|uniref:alpha/beta fold hydrolase n=1 Tax=Humitalea sp. 24SJ18S-53 TaxID=3422307 RepID=UPI003D674D2D